MTKTAGGRRVSSAGGAERILTGDGDKLQLRRAPKGGWSRKKEAAFLTALAETCNVTLACREAGVSSGSAYARRKKVAAFRTAWREAIAVAYRRLELVLLERSFNGTEKLVTRKDGSEERVREYPNAIALQLLKMHQDEVSEAEREFTPDETEKLRVKLLDKLERLRKREAGADSGDGEDGKREAGPDSGDGEDGKGE